LKNLPTVLEACEIRWRDRGLVSLYGKNNGNGSGSGHGNSNGNGNGNGNSNGNSNSNSNGNGNGNGNGRVPYISFGVRARNVALACSDSSKEGSTAETPWWASPAPVPSPSADGLRGLATYCGPAAPAGQRKHIDVVRSTIY